METPSQTLHRLTWYARYDEGTVWDPPVDDPRVVRDFVPNDIERLPWFFKRYDGSLPLVDLPRELPATTAPAVSVLAGTATVPPRTLDLEQLSRLLHLSAGIVRTTVRPYGTWLFRAAGSAGGRFPLELYVAVPEGTALPGGVHWYHPEEHALVRIGPPPSGGAPTVVVTGVPWRTGWRYRERGYRHIYWDAGTMLSQLLALGDSAGLAPRLFSRFPDASVAELVGADRLHEWPVAIVALGGEGPAIGATGSAVAGAVDAAPVEFPLATQAQRAGDLALLGAPRDRGAPVDVVGRGGPVEDVIRARGSIRLLDRGRGVTEDLLRTSMSAAMRGIDVPHFVAVHDAGDIAPGLYRWPDLSAPRRGGDLRDEMHRVAMDQGLAHDAAFVVIGSADVGTLDDRGYREAQLSAGIVEGRLHLLAYALGAAASGMTFVDAAIPALLGEPLDGLLLTCVGVPEYRSARAGLPGNPTAVATITPRE
ncbi:MAG TPA: hypothetical protein VFT27_08735 [Actinomycetota bacterium]|nr:hypothetical protein [Actinomycetota bacterium]